MLRREEVIEGLQGVDHIIHAGDIDKKEVLDELEKIAPVTAVRGNADKGTSHEEIAAKLKISEDLAEQICRMYFTHPGVDVAGILQRIG